MPYNSLSHSDQFNLHKLGLPELTSASALCTASKIRYLHAHNDLIRGQYLQLLDSCNDLPLTCLPTLSRPFWDSPALVSVLVQTARGEDLEDDQAAQFASLISDTLHEIDHNAIGSKSTAGFCPESVLSDTCDKKVQRAVYKELGLQIAEFSQMHGLVYSVDKKQIRCNT
eukprot:7017723-Karenia_brevis.AAC.1